MEEKVKMIVYIDMDDTLADFKAAMKQPSELEYPQSKVGFFFNLEPLPDAIQSVNFLRTINKFDVYILTAPSVLNPHCYSEKRLWVEKHFDLEFCDKLIISKNKGLMKGDLLIDDMLYGRNQENFVGMKIQYGSDNFKDWDTIVNHIKHEYLNG